MLKIKDNIDLKELEKFGFINAYKEYSTYNDGKPISWWNDGRDLEQYKYYYYGYDKYFVSLNINEKDRMINCITPCDYNTYDTNSHLFVLYDIIQAGLVEKIEEKEKINNEKL